MLTPDQKGNIAEQAIALAATKAGIEVYRPVGEGGRCDLIFNLPARPLRIQCKWAPRRGEVVCLSCRTSRRTAEGFRRSSYTPDEVDAFAAYCADLDCCYLVPIDRFSGRASIHLRVGPTMNGQRGGVIWADEFNFTTLDWNSLGAVAQLEERRHGMAEAGGSSPPSSTPQAATAVGAHEFRNRFGWYMERAAGGEEIRVSRHGRPTVRLVPERRAAFEGAPGETADAAWEVDTEAP